MRGEDDVEGAVHDHLKDLVKPNKAVVDHRAVANFLALPQPTLGIQKLCWEVAIGGNVPFEDDFLVWMAVGIDFTLTTIALRGPNKIVVMPE